MNPTPTLIDASLSVNAGYATLRFERDDLRNALTGTNLINDLCNTIAWANANKAISTLIITGAGKAFSSGGNVKEMRDKQGMFGGSQAEISDSYRNGIQRISRAMHSAEIVTIAAVNGAVDRADGADRADASVDGADGADGATVPTGVSEGEPAAPPATRHDDDDDDDDAPPDSGGSW